MKKSRFLYAHPDVNPGKVAALDALQPVYTEHLQACVAAIIAARRFKVARSEYQTFFPRCSTLSSQIVKNIRDHAVAIISGWASSKYATTLRRLIKTQFKAGAFDEAMRSSLYILGKKLRDKPAGKVTQQALDLYWSWLLDEEIVGRTPIVSNRVGMRMSEMTCTLATSAETKLATWWLGFSYLDAGKARIQVPLVANPYVKCVSDVSNGVLARKTKQGRWRFEVVERKEWKVPEVAADDTTDADDSAPSTGGGALRIGVDVGLNVMIATSDGRLIGADVKPKFDALYARVKNLRKNRQRQGLLENSPRLDVLEAKLTGMVKTCAGQSTNILVAAYPRGTVFVIENLDLRGCRGQKRFAYRAVHNSLVGKAPREIVNRAYTSQPCPSCLYLSRLNRSGTKFRCRSCGRISHADVVGGINLLGRSEDKQIDVNDNPSEVKAILRERYRRRRDSSSGGLVETALAPSSRRLTTVGTRILPGTGTASNPITGEDQDV